MQIEIQVRLSLRQAFSTSHLAACQKEFFKRVVDYVSSGLSTATPSRLGGRDIT